MARLVQAGQQAQQVLKEPQVQEGPQVLAEQLEREVLEGLRGQMARDVSMPAQ